MFEVWEFVGKALAVQILLGVHGLMQHDLVGDLDVFVAILLARAWRVILQVTVVKTVVVVGVDHSLGSTIYFV